MPQHQPHPPGYPVYIGLAKLSTALYSAAGAGSAAVHGLAIWSAIGGVVLIVAMFSFSRDVFRDAERALVAAFLAAVTPLMWFSALRPMSDVAGLAVAFVSLAAVARAGRAADWQPGQARMLIAGAFIAALSVGFRSQMALLTMPFLGWVLVRPKIPARVRVWSAAAAVAGGLLWAVPLILESGGVDAYVRALGSQAGEDFTGVVMLWTHPTLKVAVVSLLNTFTLPWESPVLAGAVLSIAAAGFLICCAADRRTAVLALVAFGPYLVFHLLFQETLTTRYALPIVPLIAMFAASLLAAARPGATVAGTVALAAASLAFALPAGAAYGRTESPAFQALSEMRLLGQGREPLVGMHRRMWSETRRARSWTGGTPGRLLQSPRDYEWLEVTRAWRDGNTAQTWFVADPRRTDLALIDSEHRRTREYRWPLDRIAYLGGGRPDELDWHVYDEPGWFLEQGWALTPEVAGITARDGWGPHVRPSAGWIRRRDGEALLMLGGRHLGGATDPPARVTVVVDDRVVGAFETGPGFFLRFFPLAAGALRGNGTFARLAVAASGTGDGTPAPPVALEQFNLQDAGVVQFGFGDGWYEPEFNPRTSRLWRWMSEAARLQVQNAGQDVSIEIRGESPLRYYDEPPVLRVVAGERTLGELRPDRDFVMAVTAPAGVLESSAGAVVLKSSAFFVPGDRDGTADRRRLALRIYSVRVTGNGSRTR